MSNSSTIDKYSVLLFGLAAVLLVTLSRPFAPTWYDENYTLIFFVSRGPATIFSDYHLPNNHILYSFGLWLWAHLVGDGLISARVFSFLGTALALPGLYLAGANLGNRRIGLFAVVLFSASHIAGSFATELRGYGLSIGLIGLALGFATRWWTNGYSSTASGLAYAVFGAMAIAVLPTNILFVGAIGAWSLLAGGAWRQASSWRLLTIAAGPLVGLSAYAAVWGQFTAMANTMAASPYGAFLHTIVLELFLYDSPWALPLIAAGMWQLRREPNKLPFLWLILLCVVVLATPVVTAVPFPRNFLPLVVFVSLLSGWALATLARNVHPSKILLFFALAVTLAIVVRESALRHFEAERWTSADGKPQDLIDQYYHSPNYNPDEIRAVLNKIERPTRILAADDVGMDIPEIWLGENRNIQSCIVLRRGGGCMLGSPGDHAPESTLVIDHTELLAKMLIRRFPGLPTSYRLELVFDSGKYFRIWRLSINP